ncbi:general secretion pathway protein F [Bradyrhizobium sp. USDA 3397]
MAQFQYKVVAPDGSVARGRLEAADRYAAAARLQSQGNVPLTLEPFEPVTGFRALLSQEIGGAQRRGPKLAADLVGRLSPLLDAGVALEPALSLLAGSEGQAAIKHLAAELLRRLRGGAGLSDAMAAYGDTFSPLVVAMVRAGEASGALAATLGRLADHLSRAEAVRQSIRSALIYPAVLLMTAVGSVLLVLLSVLPQLEPIFAEAGERLPLMTRMAFAASALLRQFWWVGVVCAGLSFLVGRRLLADPNICNRRDAIMLRLPVLGMTIRRAEAARFVRVLGTLLSGGITLAPSLVLARPVLGNRMIVEVIERTIGAVRGGSGLAGPLAQGNVFPELAVQMIKIGEATGRLDSILLRLADLLDSEVQRTLDRALALLVPILTIGLGGLVAGIIASVMLAVLGINDLLH